MAISQAPATAGRPISDDDVAALRALVRGDLLRPGDAEYERARQVFNKMVDRHPALIVRAVDAADVIAAVNFARERKLDLSVRGGSHNVVGFATNDGGIVIDLSRMRGVHVDPARQRVRAEGGCTWGDVDHATHAFGYAVPAGLVSTTGIGGLTLGGGIGHLTRAYGLSCDNLISADVVTADGRLIVASADENPDLFWGLRGGGGNFGVVTSFEYRLSPVSDIVGGPIIYPIERARDVLGLYREVMASAPNDLNAFFAFLIVPDAPTFPEHLRNQRACAVALCYSGPRERADETLRPFREFGPPALDATGPMPLPALNSMFDAMSRPGEHFNYWKADFANELSDAMLDTHAEYGPRVPSGSSGMHIYPVNGAVHRVSNQETAWAYRDAEYTHIIIGEYPDPADTERTINWVRAYWDALHPYSAGGAYVNFLMDEGNERLRATYRDNYDRLVELKRKYDPTNLFHMNQNIAPEPAEATPTEARA
ncbi:MAG TPA: FAD-binding oxidoreductase [Ktedonobacterales bacterium]|nr:FAD-binding oxidoreductase [Ktedonobacterales bacterium]